MSALFRPPAMNVRSVRVTADKERTGRPPIYAVASNAPHPLYLGEVDVGRIGKQFTLRQTELRPFPYLRVGFTLRRLQPRSPSGASAISGAHPRRGSGPWHVYRQTCLRGLGRVGELETVNCAHFAWTKFYRPVEESFAGEIELTFHC